MNFTSCQELVKKIFVATESTGKLLKHLQKTAHFIDKKYDPRCEFNRWRDSREGKMWKKEKWISQNKCCAICHQKIVLKGSHIDHIKPIVKYPLLSIEKQNMQVTCANCNVCKSSQVKS